jgi:hypothetical protein
MAAARMGVRGLSTDEVQSIRDGLGAGRRPRVVFTAAAGQIAGQVGQVVSLLDPAESDEWVVVRFGRDELPFSPGDLQVAPKGVPVRKAVAPAPEPVAAARPEPEFMIDKPVPGTGTPPSAGRRAQPDGVASAPRKADGVPGTATTPAPGKADGATTPAPAPRRADGAPAAATMPAPAPRKAAARAGKAKGPAGLTVTLAYADGEWTLAAAQGAKALAKQYVIRPVEALRMVSLVDVPGVQEAVEQIMAAERADAEQQAERLRAELAEIEARLAELREPG